MSVQAREPGGKCMSIINEALKLASSHVQEQKKRMEDMIAEEATIDGLENVECKVFK